MAPGAHRLQETGTRADHFQGGEDRGGQVIVIIRVLLPPGIFLLSQAVYWAWALRLKEEIGQSRRKKGLSVSASRVPEF